MLPGQLAPSRNCAIEHADICDCCAETDDEVMLEFELPFWIEEGDCSVHITGAELVVVVRNELAFRRTYWPNRYENVVAGRMNVLLAMCILRVVNQPPHPMCCQAGRGALGRVCSSGHIGIAVVPG